MAIQTWTFACKHVLAGEDPHLESKTTLYSSEVCAGCQLRASRSEKTLQESLDTFKSQFEGIQRHLKQARKDGNDEMVQDFIKMEMNCILLWAKIIADIRLNNGWRKGSIAKFVLPGLEDIQQLNEAAELFRLATIETYDLGRDLKLGLLKRFKDFKTLSTKMEEEYWAINLQIQDFGKRQVQIDKDILTAVKSIRDRKSVAGAGRF